MRNRNRMMMWGSLILLSSGYVRAGAVPAINELGQFGSQKKNLTVLEEDGPKLQLGEMTGTISAYDEILEKISVTDVRGKTIEFLWYTNSPITDHNLGISFTDLHLGDQVTVHYNVSPRRVNRIERISSAL